MGRELLFVGLGGAAGAIARFLVGVWLAARWGDAFPWGTLVINVSGCLLLGYFGTVALDRALALEWRLLVAVGFLGAYTTFATFGFETLTLLQGGAPGAAAAYVAASVLLGLAATWAGLLLARGLA